MRNPSIVPASSIRVATGTHIGRVRTTNEDRIYADPDRGGFAVIDGVGGQAAGEHAAQIALDTIRQRLQLQIGTPAERVREAIALANDQIHQQSEAQSELRGMACVLTLVLLQNGTLTAGHVGDTRLYKMRGGTLRKLTHDHSPIGEREDRGELTESEAMRHPRRNEVYREVGAEPRGPDDEGFIEVVEEPFEPDAALLLCSDGLSDALSSVAIAGIIARHAGDPTLIVEQLIDRANEEYGKDNVSIIYIEGSAFAAAPKVKSRGDLKPVAVPKSSAANPSAIPGAAMGSGATAYGTPSVKGSPSRASIARDAVAAGAAIDGLSVPNGGTTRSGAGAGVGAGGTTSSRGTASGAARAAAPAVATTAARESSTIPGRAIAFIVGLLAGVALAIGVAYYMRDMLIPVVPAPTSDAPRTLFVGSPGPTATAAVAPYQTIALAMAAARPGDTIVVGPGEYREQIVVKDGVNLIASPPREAIVRATAQPPIPPVLGGAAIIATGAEHGSRVSGFRLAGDPQGQMIVGVRAAGKTVLDDLDVSNTIAAAVRLSGGATMMSSSVLHDNVGVALEVQGGEARVAHNVFTRNASLAPNGSAPPAPPGSTPPPAGTDITLSDAPRVTFLGNVITGELAQRVRGLGAEQAARFRESNIVLPTPPAARPRTSTPRRTPR